MRRAVRWRDPADCFPTGAEAATTLLEAGWDFVSETANGTEDIWWILEGKDYPRLWWQAAPQ